MTRVDRVAVVVPVRDEELLLPGCLDALAAAVDAVHASCDVDVAVVVVLDACVDRSADVVAAAPWAHALEVDHGSVGAARRAGAREALTMLGRDSAPATDPAWLATTWLATTDGDSQVPPGWLTGMTALAAAGADLVVGTVVVDDWAGHAPAVRERWRQAYGTSDPHPHVHGANLGLTAAAYESIGGFPGVAVDEDVALVEASAGLRVVRTRALPVRTSGRPRSRVAGGFADHLRGLGVPEGKAV